MLCKGSVYGPECGSSTPALALASCSCLLLPSWAFGPLDLALAFLGFWASGSGFGVLDLALALWIWFWYLVLVIGILQLGASMDASNLVVGFPASLGPLDLGSFGIIFSMFCCCPFLLGLCSKMDPTWPNLAPTWAQKTSQKGPQDPFLKPLYMYKCKP